MEITRQFLAENARISIDVMGSLNPLFKHEAFVELQESMRRIEEQNMTPSQALKDHIVAIVGIGKHNHLVGAWQGTAVQTNCESLLKFLQAEGATL